MANFPSIDLPRGFAGKLQSNGNCLDCGEFCSVYTFTGFTKGAPLEVPVPLVVHQGKACSGFRERFTLDGSKPAVTAAVDEQGTFVDGVPGSEVIDDPGPVANFPPDRRRATGQSQAEGRYPAPPSVAPGISRNEPFTPPPNRDKGG